MGINEGAHAMLGASDQMARICRGLKDAFSHGVEGIIFWELSKCTPTVFRFAWPDDVRKDVVSKSNPITECQMVNLKLTWYSVVL
jgi:hypothetical protein